MRLEGKIAVITGGASGIGACTVERFISEGASVVVVSIVLFSKNYLAEDNEKRIILEKIYILD